MYRSQGKQSVQDFIQSPETGGGMCGYSRGPWRGRCQSTGKQDDLHRRKSPQGSPHGLQPEGKTEGPGRLIGRTKGGMNARCDRHDWPPIRFFMTAGQVRGDTGARALVSSLPAADWLLGDRGCDADKFREALVRLAIKPCIINKNHHAKPLSTTSCDTKNATEDVCVRAFLGFTI